MGDTRRKSRRVKDVPKALDLLATLDLKWDNMRDDGAA